MTKIYYNRQVVNDLEIKYLTESVFLAPFEDPEKFTDRVHFNDRLRPVINGGKEHLELTDIKSCDFVVLPYKWQGRTPLTDKLISEAVGNGKKIVILHNDDDDGEIEVSPDEGYVYRTSFYKSKRKSNEFGFPAFCADHYDGNIIEDFSAFSVGFMGQAYVKWRLKSLAACEKSEILKTDFTYRTGYWAPEMKNKKLAKEEFLGNMRRNLFNLCVRGDGNYSYRIYETFCMARIPINVMTDQVLPFEKIIDYDRQSVVIPFDDIENLDSYLKNFLDARSAQDLIALQHENRRIWEEYFSPMGFIKNFHKEIEFSTLTSKGV